MPSTNTQARDDLIQSLELLRGVADEVRDGHMEVPADDLGIIMVLLVNIATMSRMVSHIVAPRVECPEGGTHQLLWLERHDAMGILEWHAHCARCATKFG